MGADASLGAAAYAEDTGPQVARLLERDLDRTDERVALLVGMAAHHVDELGGQLIGVPAEAFGIALGQLDNEVVGHQRASLGHDRGSIIELTLQRSRSRPVAPRP